MNTFKSLKPLRLSILAFIFALMPAPDIAAQQPAPAEIKKLPPIHYVRSRDYDMRHVALDLRFDWEKEQTFGTATLTLAPMVSGLKTVNLDAGAMVINSVKLADGRSLQFDYDEKNTRLAVSLDRVYRINEPLTLTVEYRTKSGETVENTLGFGGGGGLKFVKPTAENPFKRRTIWSQGETDYNRFWFPSYDSPNDFRTTELTATVEKPLMVISNGKLLEVKDNGDNTRTYHWKISAPHANYLTSIVVGEYAEVKGEYDGIPISTFVFPDELKEGEVTARRLPAMVKFFSEKTGVRYPYEKYAQTMAQDFSGGMENISATTMTPSMIHDARTALDEDSDALQSHELAHQWFGDYVTTREWSDIWLNESFATYFEALWMEESKGRDFFLYTDIRGNQQAYLNTWRQGNRRPIVTKNYPNADALFDTYAYPRGGAVLHMLRRHLGDELFFKAINHYLVSNAHKPVQTEQLRIAIEEATGQSMDWFFDQWLYKMGHPVFEVSQNYDEAKKQLTLNVRQTQKTDPNNEYPQAEFFQTFVEIEIGTPSGTRVERVWIEPKAENVFTFGVDARPNLVNFDYEGALIKELKFEKPIADLVFQMRNDKDVLGRLWALNQLAERRRAATTTDAEKSQIVAAMNQTIARDSFWGIRRDAINALAPTNQLNQAPPVFDQATINTLTAAAKDPDSHVRAAAVIALGTQNDAKYADLFLSAVNDQSYSVIDYAAVALANTKDERAYAALNKLAETDSWRDRTRVAGLRGLSRLADKRSFDLGLKYAGKTYRPNVRSAALMVVAAAGKGDARAFPLVFENFKTALANSDFQSIFNGLSSIASLGDPRGQEAFDLAKAKFKNQSNLLGYVSQIEAQFKTAMQKK